MKSPQALIRERERIAPPNTRHTRIYGYVKPHRSGEATIEFWGARTRKGKVMCKCFFKFRTDRDKYFCKDVAHYHSWSYLCPSHICYSFPEAGSMDYMKLIGDTHGHWNYNYISETDKPFLPRYATMLNDFSGTKYKYCGYSHNCGMFVIDYLRFWERHPKAEIISKSGNFRLLTDSFMKRLETQKPFAKYVARYHAAITEHAIGIRDIYKFYRQNRDLNAYVALMREEARRRAEAEAAKLREKYAAYDTAIAKLYERVKDICATYGAYEVVVPQTSADMIEEGIAMHNCVGQCYAPRQGKSDLVIFLHRDGKPCVDIRIDLTTFALVECRAVCNKQADDAAWAVAREVAEMCRMRLAA